MNIEGIYYTTVRTDDGATITKYRPERAAALAICARAMDKADAVLLLEACGLLTEAVNR